ncbi:MAG: hypothetical protein ACRD2R_08635, partial [Terriglobales bacterium]
MPAVVEILVTLDEKGVVTGARNIEGGLEKVGQRGNVVFTGLSKQQKQANDAAQLLGRTMGVQLPRELNRFLSRSSLLGPLLSTAFNASIVLAFGAAIVALVPKIKEAAQELGGFTEKMRALEKAAADANAALFGTFSTSAQGQALLRQIDARTAALDRERNAGVATAGGILAVLASKRRVAAIDDQLVELTNLRIKALDRLGVVAEQEGEKSKAAAEKAAAAYKHQREELEKVLQLLDKQRGLAGKAAEEGSKNIADNLFKQAQQQLENELKLNERRLETLGTIREADRQLQIDRAQFSGDSVRAIVLQEQFRLEDTLEKLKLIEAGDKDLAQVRALLNQQANLKILTAERDRNREMVEQFRQATEQMGDFFVSIWDDITSGNIGRRILQGFKRLIAQIVAQWLFGLGAIRRSASGGFQFGGGGGFLGILGTLLGLGGLGTAGALGGS